MNDETDIPKKWVGGVCIYDGKILLIHRINKKRTSHQEYFVFPGKQTEDDESIEDAVLEEFANISITVELGVLMYSKENGSGESEHYYSCSYLLGEPALVKKEEESEEESDSKQFYTPMWISLSELDELIVYPEEIKNKIIEGMEEGGEIDKIQNIV